MLIKIIRNGEMSDWQEHNKELHEIMRENKPEYVVIAVKDFYEKGPDADKTEIVSFEVFDCIYREVRLAELAQAKSDERHLVHNHDNRNDPSDFDMLAYIIKQEENAMLYEALSRLSKIERNRVIRKYFENETGEEIGKREGVSQQAADKSVKKSLKKLYKMLKKFDF